MSKLPPVYLLLGPESGEKQEFIQSVRSAIEKRTGEKPEEPRFYPFETGMSELVALLRNGSLFSAHRLVLLDSVEQLTTKADIELLSGYCEHPVEDATLFLLSDQTQVDKRLAAAVPADHRKIFWEMFDNQKLGWVTSYLRKQGCSISGEAANLLLEMVENNTQELRRECDRLALYFGRDHEIGADDVETFIYHSKEENVFTLFEEMAACNFDGSLEILQKMMLGSEANPVAIIAGLTWQFRRLLALAILLEERYSARDAFMKLNIRGKRVQKNYETGGRNFSRENLERVLVLSARYDALFRRLGSAVHPLLLQLYVYSVVIRKGQEPAPAHHEMGEYEL
ncbi:DNA polymerase III subunit delta [Salinispira pacifica]